ncbi:MAG: cellulase family glycosylhydrolase [Candidatus Izimaplasma sp.]|nr:cellulase family glycosylhydrolase [Candidatus Izimaplasma bacterium]
MKKIIILLVILMTAVLVSCNSDKVTVPNFYDKPYNDVLKWGVDNDISVTPNSLYSDEVEPLNVLDQSIEPGTIIDKGDDIAITYSRGYDPEGVISLPDFTGQSQEAIKNFFQQEDIKKYRFFYTFDPNTPKDEFVKIDVIKQEDRDAYKRKDEYNIYLSKGALEIEELRFTNPDVIRGVNLGGWFVLEGWMTPYLFEGVSGSDETVYLDQAPNAIERIEEHWDTFITKDDFYYLKSIGITTVRLPIPWWLFGGVAYEYDETLEYHSALPYVHRAMSWADELNMNILLDLHTAPGGQNGFDNGGLTDILQWPYHEEYIQKTLEVLEQLTIEFNNYSSFWGIEVLNEPGWSVPIDTLQQFYVDAYNLIREHNQSIYIGFHDGFRSYLTDTWTTFFEENNFSRVFFDLHLYQAFGDSWQDFDIFDHLTWVEVEQTKTINRYKGIVPIVIGEWSLGLQNNVFEGFSEDAKTKMKQAFANKQLNLYETTFGHFFWSYKIDRESHLEWDFKRLIETGLFPNNFETE